MNRETCLPVAQESSVYDEVREILTAIGGRLGIPLEDAELLRLHSNATFALPSAGLLVRIATNPAAYQRIATSIAITRWLGRRGFPCTVPADVPGQPFTERGKVVSLWRYVPLIPDPEPTGAELGRLLRDLHAQPAPPQPPGQFADPFTSVVSAIEEQPHAMADEDRDWLKEQITSLRGQWNALGFPLPPGLIHGDAHTGNLMRSAPGQAILGDCDHVAAGPRGMGPGADPLHATPLRSRHRPGHQRLHRQLRMGHPGLAQTRNARSCRGDHRAQRIHPASRTRDLNAGSASSAAFDLQAANSRTRPGMRWATGTPCRRPRHYQCAQRASQPGQRDRQSWDAADAPGGPLWNSASRGPG
jgi:hypothetical protein